MLQIGRENEAERKRPQESDRRKHDGLASFQKEEEQQERHQRPEYDLGQSWIKNSEVSKDIGRKQPDRLEHRVDRDRNERDHNGPNDIVPAHAAHRAILPAMMAS